MNTTTGNKSVSRPVVVAQDITVGRADPDEDENIQLVTMTIEKALDAVLAGTISHAASMIGILLIAHKQMKGEI